MTHRLVRLGESTCVSGTSQHSTAAVSCALTDLHPQARTGTGGTEGSQFPYKERPGCGTPNLSVLWWEAL